MSRPPHQAYWVACLASCLNRALPESSDGRRVMITFPRVKAGAAGTGSW
jgi:hypothetical protein